MNEERTERLFISYSADGAIIREAVARRKSAGHTYWTASMDSLHTALLPPPTCIVEVYPVFMQTGRTVRHTLPECLRAAYKPWGGCPDFCYRSVWGASPELASLAFPFLRQVLSVPSALLVIAHGHSSRQQAPEAGIFVSNLSRFLPPPYEIHLCWFGAGSDAPCAEDIFPVIRKRRVAVLPFLAGRGMHYRNDMPSRTLAAQFSKEILLLPPLGEILAPAL